jgi:hypothetical protein
MLGVMTCRRWEEISRRVRLLSALTPIVTMAAACSSSASNNSTARDGVDASASGGATSTGGTSTIGGAMNTSGARNAGGAAGTIGAGGTNTSSDAGISKSCGAVPPPLAKPLPEPLVNNADLNATLTEIAISGPMSTYATGGPGGTVSTITVSLRDQGVYSDGTVRSIENLSADINYHSKVVWTSSDPTILAVASGDSRTAGGVQAFRAGMVTITVTLGAVSHSVCFVVTPPVVAGLSIAAAGSTVSNLGAPIVEKPGDTVSLTCTETLTDGTQLDVTKDVSWASSAPSVATVSSAGSTQALTGGTTVITVSLPASVATADHSPATGTATLDVIGTTGLVEGASCAASPQGCAAGLSCCTLGRLGASSSCIPTLSPQSPCPPPPPATP